MASDFGRTAVINTLKNGRALAADNLRRCRDVPQIRLYEEAIAEFDAVLADLETPAVPVLQAVA
jgi:hypothetical protein